MKTRLLIWTLWLILAASRGNAADKYPTTQLSFDFYGNNIELQIDGSFIINNDLSTASAITSMCAELETSEYKSLVNGLLSYKSRYQLDDWLYYQLIRKTAQQISPKAANYYRYTIYKWFLLTHSGYTATLKSSDSKLLFYVQTDENIYNIPFYMRNEKQYVCLNYHDYGSIDFEKERFDELIIAGEGEKMFSYKISRLPDFRSSDYQEKDLQFNYNENTYHFKIKLNTEVKTIFANYPVVDYGSYLNIPLSRETYNTLIPMLKQTVKGMSTKNGVDYLMRFTRYAFMFEPDSKTFGKEKRFTPEQTLLYDKSDCEDRVALFFCLVKEIYDLPMIVMAFEKHVTLAVSFDRPIGKPILYNGLKYSVCEPTPQKQDLSVGQLSPELVKKDFEVVYAYNPKTH